LHMVPLSSQEERVQKLHRLLTGVVLVTVPLAVFIAVASPHIVEVLYERGQFDEGARHATAAILSISAFALVSGAVTTPLSATVQILDRVSSIGLVNLVSAATVLVLNFVFIFIVRLDVRGAALSVVASSYAALFSLIVILGRNGIKIDLIRLLKYLLYALAVSAMATFAIRVLPIMLPTITLLACEATVFFATTALFYIPARGNVRFIIYGR